MWYNNVMDNIKTLLSGFQQNQQGQANAIQSTVDKYTKKTTTPYLNTPSMVPTQATPTGATIPNKPSPQNTGAAYKGVQIDTSRGQDYIMQQMANIDKPQPGYNPTSVDIKVGDTVPSPALNSNPSNTALTEGRNGRQNTVLTSKYSKEEEKLLADIAALTKGVAGLKTTQAKEYSSLEDNPEGVFGPNALSSNLSRLSKDQALELTARTGQLNAYLDTMKLYQGYRPDVIGTPQIDEATGEAFAYVQDPTTGEIMTQSLGVIATPKAPESNGFTLGKDQTRYELDPLTGEYKAVGSGVSSGGGSRSYGGTGVQSDLSRMINVQGSFITSENQRNAFESAANSYLERGDYNGLKYYLRNQAVNNVPAADQTGYRKNVEIMKALDSLDSILSKMEASGVDTGLLSGSWQTMENKLGAQGKPELVTLLYQAQQAMDLITRQRTGAALNASEEKFYKKMVPGIFKGADLNKQLVQEFKNSLQNNTDSYLGVYFSPEEINKLDSAVAGTKPSLEDLFK